MLNLIGSLPQRLLAIARALDSTAALSSLENARSAAQITNARLRLNEIATDNQEPLSRSA